jgi:hypothetical protein
MVEELADVLEWPLITLSPPAFLRNGLEGFEASADEIFGDLMHLRRVVVLFDECEDFFRWRPQKMQIENRTIGAFITSGMLPRLQKLRKLQWVVFVINTNIEAFELDPAVTRRGRLDKVARVGYPVLDAQLRYLDRWKSRSTGRELDKKIKSWFASALTPIEKDVSPIRDSLADKREALQRKNPNRGDRYRNKMTRLQKEEAKDLKQVVTFAILDQLAMRCIGEGLDTPITSGKSLKSNLAQEFERFGPDKFREVK